MQGGNNQREPIGSLAGRKALITGGGRGIGRAVALAFTREGADVALTARTESEIYGVAVEVETLGQKAYPIVCDVADKAQVALAAREAEEKLGRIDILVNNAGVAQSHKFIDHDDWLWEYTLAVNLTGVYYVTKQVVPGMVQRGWGRIINMASIAAKAGAKYIAAYTASKHGVLGLTRALAMEFVGDGITVNAICPGYVDTPMTDASVANIVRRTGRSEAAARQIIENSSPQKRLVQPEEVAAVAVMLAGDLAGGITGQAINVDGGAVMF